MTKIELTKKLCIGDVIRIDNDYFRIRKATKGCFGCAFQVSVKACTLKGVCVPRFRPDKQRIIFTSVFKDTLTADNTTLDAHDPFLIIKYHNDFYNQFVGNEPNSRYEIITLQNVDSDSRRREYISDAEFETLSKQPHRAYKSEIGYVYDFNHFKEAYNKHRDSILKILQHGTNALEKAI